jgi:nicotinamide-nucleotide amidase
VSPVGRRAAPPRNAVEILATGDELVRGRGSDTNFAALARALGEEGFAVRGGRLVGDDLDDLVAALRAAAARARVVVMSGGLGPTRDDLTREALARLAGAPLVEDAPCLRRLRALWRRRGLAMPPSNAVQALLPRGAVALRNRVGSAPGILLGLRGGARVFALPGPPRELLPMLEAEVLPRLRRLPGRVPSRTLHAGVFGMFESALGERLADLMDRDAAVKVGTAVKDGVITVSVHGEGPAARRAPAVHREVLARLGPAVFAADRSGLPEAALAALRRARATCAFAESCTGGLAAARLTEVPGASAALLGGAVTYADAEKERALGVPRALLRVHGAVSGPVAEAMASGIRERTGATLAVSVTGVAGPDGGSARKPVGLVWFGMAGPGGVRTVERRFTGDRAFVRALAANTALDLLRRAAEALRAGAPAG